MMVKSSETVKSEPASADVLARPALSVIIPALNEAEQIGRTLEAVVGHPEVSEVIVVDGGSRDETVQIARRAGACVIRSVPGRGVQMAAGAAASIGEVLWFLHADTVPSPEAASAVREAMRDPKVVAGNCKIRFGNDRPAARFLSWLYPHLRKIGLLYGDSGIFVRRSAYEAAGGFGPYPIFEDLDLVRRLRGLGRLTHLQATVKTSDRRFEGRSFTLTFAFWSGLQILYWCRVPPKILGRLYYPSTRDHAAHPDVYDQDAGPLREEVQP